MYGRERGSSEYIAFTSKEEALQYILDSDAVSPCMTEAVAAAASVEIHCDKTDRLATEVPFTAEDEAAFVKAVHSGSAFRG